MQMPAHPSALAEFLLSIACAIMILINGVMFYRSYRDWKAYDKWFKAWMKESREIQDALKIIRLRMKEHQQLKKYMHPAVAAIDLKKINEDMDALEERMAKHQADEYPN